MAGADQSTDSPEASGLHESGAPTGDLAARASDALKQGSDFVYAHTPDVIKDGVVDLYSALLGDGTTPQPASAQPAITPPGPPAPRAQPAPTEVERAHAALICGYTANDAPRQITDAELARYFGVSPKIIAARREDFYRRWVIRTTRAALNDCSVLPRAILQHPHIAPQLSQDLWSWRTIENMFSGAVDGAEEVVGSIAEPILHMGTAAVAKSISDVFGLAATAFEATEGGTNADFIPGFKKHIQEGLTYQPRTPAGQSPVNPLNSIPAWLGKLLELTLPKVPQDASTGLGMATNAFREAVPQALAIGSAKLHFGPKLTREGEPLPGEVQSNEAPPPPDEASTETSATTTGAYEAESQTAAIARQAVRDYANVSRLSQLLQNTLMCRENPELCRKIVKEMAANGDLHTLYVPRDAFLRMAREHGVPAKSLLSRMLETQVNKGLLAIPAHEYFTALPASLAQDMAALMKTNPANKSLAESLAQGKATQPEAGKAEPQVTETAGKQEAEANTTNQQHESPEDTDIQANPAPTLTPGGGLDAHEAEGGHLIKKHVEKTEQELIERLINEPKITGSSSFFSHAAAEDAAARTIKANDAKIASWLTTSKVKKLEITATMNAQVGHKVVPGATVATKVSGVKLVLIRKAEAPLGYYIHTGFPQ